MPTPNPISRKDLALRIFSKEKLLSGLSLVLLLFVKPGNAQPTDCGESIKAFNTGTTSLAYFECGEGEPIQRRRCVFDATACRRPGESHQ